LEKFRRTLARLSLWWRLIRRPCGVMLTSLDRKPWSFLPLHRSPPLSPALLDSSFPISRPSSLAGPVQERFTVYDPTREDETEGLASRDFRNRALGRGCGNSSPLKEDNRAEQAVKDFSACQAATAAPRLGRHQPVLETFRCDR
jgi:hypothetical protein